MEGIERIKVLSAEIKDEAVIEIVNHLLTRNDMNEKYLNEEKSLKEMIEYIKGEAKKKAQNGIAILKDDIVFGLAIHYWDETNKELGLCKEKNEEVIKVENKEIKEWKPEGQLTLF